MSSKSQDIQFYMTILHQSKKHTRTSSIVSQFHLSQAQSMQFCSVFPMHYPVYCCGDFEISYTTIKHLLDKRNSTKSVSKKWQLFPVTHEKMGESRVWMRKIVKVSSRIQCCKPSCLTMPYICLY